MFILDGTISSLKASKLATDAEARKTGLAADLASAKSNELQSFAGECYGASDMLVTSAQQDKNDATGLLNQANGLPNTPENASAIQLLRSRAQLLIQRAEEKLKEARDLKTKGDQANQQAETKKTEAEYQVTKATELTTKSTELDQRIKQLEQTIQEEKTKLPAGKRESGGVQPGTTDPTTGLAKKPGETDEEFAKRIKQTLGQPDKGLGLGNGSAGGLVSAARGLLSQIAMNAARTISSNPIVMIAKNLFNKSLGEQAVALLEAAQIEEVLGSGIKQQIILLHAQAKTIVGESTANVEFWKQVIQENKQLARATHELAKGAA